MSEPLGSDRRQRMIESMKLIQLDCESDATAIDGTGFTAHGVGTNFGNLYAMVAAVAKAVELLAQERE